MGFKSSTNSLVRRVVPRTAASKKALVLTLVLFATLAFPFSYAAAAVALNTVDWTADGSNDGQGSGTLNGSILVTYQSAAGFNSGQTFSSFNWDTNLGTAGATGAGVTFDSGGALGGSSAGTLETITFSDTVVQPILLVNFLGYNGGSSGDFFYSFDLGSTGFTLLSSYNAALSPVVPNAIVSTKPTDSTNDGFGIQLQGTFGPSHPLQFYYLSNGAGPDALQTVGFTIGVQSVPEPLSMTTWGGLAGCLFAFMSMRRRRSR